jgi:hypothetical protein
LTRRHRAPPGPWDPAKIPAVPAPFVVKTEEADPDTELFVKIEQGEVSIARLDLPHNPLGPLISDREFYQEAAISRCKDAARECDEYRRAAQRIWMGDLPELDSELYARLPPAVQLRARQARLLWACATAWGNQAWAWEHLACLIHDT